MKNKYYGAQVFVFDFFQFRAQKFIDIIKIGDGPLWNVVEI